MVPAIGYMIAGYIVFRCIDIFSAPGARFRSEDWRYLMRIAAGLLIGWSLLLCFELYLLDLEIAKGAKSLLR